MKKHRALRTAATASVGLAMAWGHSNASAAIANFTINVEPLVQDLADVHFVYAYGSSGAPVANSLKLADSIEAGDIFTTSFAPDFSGPQWSWIDFENEYEFNYLHWAVLATYGEEGVVLGISDSYASDIILNGDSYGDLYWSDGKAELRSALQSGDTPVLESFLSDNYWDFPTVTGEDGATLVAFSAASDNGIASLTVSAIPEPATSGLLFAAAALAAVGIYRRRKA